MIKFCWCCILSLTIITDSITISITNNDCSSRITWYFFDFKCHLLLRNIKPGFKGVRSTLTSPELFASLSQAEAPWRCCCFAVFLMFRVFCSFHMHSRCCPFGMAGMSLTCFHCPSAETLWRFVHRRDVYSCFAVRFLNTHSSIIRIIGVTAQPLQHFPFET